MIKLMVYKVEGSNYTLIDEKENKYQLELKFFDIEKQPNIGSVILMHESLLDPNYIEYDKLYYFGALDKPYGRKVKKGDIDFISIKIDDDIINLKRFFG